ncbi:MAG: NUDIX domain-containing protein [Gammaproteobacteria bacterium]|nr:MAG: NUDIX domain-containing protein [Gammaproteobacteria bacterium]
MNYNYCPKCGCGLIKRVVDDRKRTCCINAECDFVFWNNPVPVVAAIVEHDNKVLLARNSEWSEGKFALIAGYMEEGETPELAVIRELKEETNLDGKIASLCGHYMFEEKNQLMIIFHVKATGTIKLSPELAEAKHFSKDEITPWGSCTGQAMAEWLKKNR